MIFKFWGELFLQNGYRIKERLRARETGTVWRERRERENCPLRVNKSANMRGHAEMNERRALKQSPRSHTEWTLIHAHTHVCTNTCSTPIHIVL